jgi:hypothetical protein
MPTKKQKNKAPTCRVCGCTDKKACPGGCFWIEPDLCSACAKKMPIITMEMKKIITIGKDRTAIYMLKIKAPKHLAENAIEKFKVEIGLVERTIPNES